MDSAPEVPAEDGPIGKIRAFSTMLLDRMMCFPCYHLGKVCYSFFCFARSLGC